MWIGGTVGSTPRTRANGCDQRIDAGLGPEARHGQQGHGWDTAVRHGRGVAWPGGAKGRPIALPTQATAQTTDALPPCIIYTWYCILPLITAAFEAFCQ